MCFFVSLQEDSPVDSNNKTDEDFNWKRNWKKEKEKESVIVFKVKDVWLDWNLVEEGNGQKKVLSMIHEFCVKSESCLGYVYRTNPDGQAEAISGAAF